MIERQTEICEQLDVAWYGGVVLLAKPRDEGGTGIMIRITAPEADRLAKLVREMAQ